MQLSHTQSLACVTLLVGYTFAQCGTSPRVPAPRNSICNVKGTLIPSAEAHRISYELQSSLTGCATLCLNNADCKFAGQDSGTTCALYNATGDVLGFTADPTADTTYFRRSCYVQPESCSFKLRCSAGDSCAGKYVAALAGTGTALYPAAFVSDPNETFTELINFTIQNRFGDMVVTQNDRQGKVGISASNPYTLPSEVFTFDPSGNTQDIYGLQCAYRNSDSQDGSKREQKVICIDGTSNGFKTSFYACQNERIHKQTLRIAPAAYYLAPCLGNCYREDITLEPVDYVAHV